MIILLLLILRGVLVFEEGMCCVKGDFDWRGFDESLDNVEEVEVSFEGAFIKEKALCFGSIWVIGFDNVFGEQCVILRDGWDVSSSEVSALKHICFCK